uniref:Uncharacterized protein n=1 Tax=Ditylenchus dipsaci TaxID=166011 RepID=A0A915EW90_9BILA
MTAFIRKIFGFNKSSSNHLQTPKSVTEKKLDHRGDQSLDYEKNNSLYLSFDSEGSSNAVSAAKQDDVSSSVYSINVKISNKGILFMPAASPLQSVASNAAIDTPKKNNEQPQLGFGLDTLSMSTPLRAPVTPVKPSFDVALPFGKQVKFIDKNISKYEQRMAKTMRIIKRLMSGKNPTADDLFSIENEDSEDEEDDVLDISMRSTSQMPTEKDMDDLCQRSSQLLTSWEMLHNCLLEGIGMDAIRPKDQSEKSFVMGKNRHNQSETE